MMKIIENTIVAINDKITVSYSDDLPIPFTMLELKIKLPYIYNIAIINEFTK
ncbi:hypothetical protein [Alkaliphilus peptidifermentans]|uniref:hypothetical protein n=1 Tax=Alkaliphilus peptidifermentans TaxID=426129 RepID=UPI001FA7AF06|nr:hypothetical protein [Alkaliphilus peptidifermentans]